jgi:hypothetical protein
MFNKMCVLCSPPRLPAVFLLIVVLAMRRVLSMST